MGQNLKKSFYRNIDAFENVEWLDLQKMKEVVIFDSGEINGRLRQTSYFQEFWI
jgi:hypothetical protein